MIRVGISGWRYGPWRGVWYPDGPPQRRELEFCARHFPTVEINGSFYSLQRPDHYTAWHRATPPGFVFAVKGSRYVTHFSAPERGRPLATLASGVLALARSSARYLQLPPTLVLRAVVGPGPSSRPAADDREALALAPGGTSALSARPLSIAPTRRAPLGRVPHASFVTTIYGAGASRHSVAVVVSERGKCRCCSIPLWDVSYAFTETPYLQALLDRAGRLGTSHPSLGRSSARSTSTSITTSMSGAVDALGLMRLLGLVWNLPTLAARRCRAIAGRPDARDAAAAAARHRRERVGKLRTGLHRVPRGRRAGDGAARPRHVRWRTAPGTLYDAVQHVPAVRRPTRHVDS